MDDAVIVKVDHLNLAEVKIASGLEKAIRALAFGLQAQAQENIRANGTIDTGALEQLSRDVDAVFERAAAAPAPARSVA